MAGYAAAVALAAAAVAFGACARSGTGSDAGGGGSDAAFLPGDSGAWDLDGDGIGVPIDCDDADPANFPGNVEVADGGDNDCDGYADDGLPGVDADGDGFDGPADCNDANPDIFPGAAELANAQDDDCDGMVDEGGTIMHTPCDCGGGITSPAVAVGMCDGLVTESASGPADAREILSSWTMPFSPSEGCTMLMLATGLTPGNQPGTYDPDPGCDYLGSGGCATIPPTFDGSANDEATVTLVFTVPMGANTLSWDFAFFSVEWPEWVGMGFNDTFEANITSTMFTGNASFDETGAPITVDNVLFDTTCASVMACDADLAGTGFDDTTDGGGTTSWLQTATPVVEGETITLELRIYDDGDGILDSAVVIDNLVFDGGLIMGGPGTTPIQ
jgi:hypothetical protein